MKLKARENFMKVLLVTPSSHDLILEIVWEQYVTAVLRENPPNISSCVGFFFYDVIKIT